MLDDPEQRRVILDYEVPKVGPRILLLASAPWWSAHRILVALNDVQLDDFKASVACWETSALLQAVSTARIACLEVLVATVD